MVQVQQRVLHRMYLGVTSYFDVPLLLVEYVTTHEGYYRMIRAWQLWVAQVDNAGLYTNDLRK